MARIGLARWLLSWMTKPLVAIRQPFDRILGLIREIVPGVSQSQVAESYRNAEVALDLAPTIESMDRDSPWEIGLMTEEKLGAPRRYEVEFEALIKDPDTGAEWFETRQYYAMKRMSASEYEAEFMHQYGGYLEKGYEYIKGVRAVNVKHNARWSY